MMIVFRADASIEIGTGHVMRCLTLADALYDQGVECKFICREYPGNLIANIRNKGYDVNVLPAPVESSAHVINSSVSQPAHAHWLGTTQELDADDCALILADLQPEWLIVDHYALDSRWETALKPHYRKLMVIDDLADRMHRCDLLLDQTLGRRAEDYLPWVPVQCKLLCGSRFALLRPEFADLRAYSLNRRQKPKLNELLITLGGVDKDNVTGRVLRAIADGKVPDECRITVVLGSSAPWLAEVQKQAASMPWPTEVRVNVSDMARLMASTDLAIGAAGATSWERCCLGVPTLMLVLAQNQRAIAQALCRAGAAQLVDQVTFKELRLIANQQMAPYALREMSSLAEKVTDGLGVSRVITYLLQEG